MSLYDMIMGGAKTIFSKLDWAALGRQEIKDEEQIKEMLAQGYGAVANED